MIDRTTVRPAALGTSGFAALLATSLLGAVLALATPTLASGQTPTAGWWTALGRPIAAAVAALGVAGLIRSYGALHRALTLRARAEAEARAEALTDDLTGLYNRRGLRALGEHQLKVARRAGTDVLLLYLDLDAFKPINDRFGHVEGDRALRDVAAILARTVRETDVVARLGGDEFCVLVVDADAHTERAVRTRIARALRAHNERPDRPYAIRCSVGSARLDDDRAAELDDLLRRADAALYAAKGAQRRVSA